MSTPNPFIIKPGDFSRFRLDRRKLTTPLPDGFGAGVQYLTFNRPNPRSFGNPEGLGFHKVIKYPVTLSGNRCGHDPENIRRIIDKSPYKTELGAKPDTVTLEDGRYDHHGNKLRMRLQYKCVDAIYGYLGDASTIAVVRQHRQLIKKGLSKYVRKHRTDGAEAFTALLAACALNMDVMSKRIGRPDPHDKTVFHYMSLSALADAAKLSLSRAKRAWKLIVDCKLISSKKICEKKEDGSYRSGPSAKCMSMDFLVSLGLKTAHDREVQSLTKKRKKAAQEQADKQANDPQVKAKAKMTREMALADAYADLGRVYTPVTSPPR